MKPPKDFNKKRIHASNIEDYLKKKYNVKEVKQTSEKLLKFSPLLQENYGGDGDCTLTSITACMNYYLKSSKPIQEIYNYVEKVAKKWGYRGDKGTMPVFIQAIYNSVLKKFPCKRKSTCFGYYKNIGFNFNTIKKLIDKSIPMVMSINNDGRNYYTNHSITIVGYRTYKINAKQTAHMLIIYDNWYESISFIDYDVLPLIAVINY